MRSTLPVPIRSLAAMAVATSLTQAVAQQSALDDVVISASRSAQRSFDAPGTIQSVDRRVIEASGPQINLSEALAGVPGIQVANRNNFAQDLQISIRGFGSRAPFGVRGVRLLIDGIPQTLPDGQGQSSQFALTSAERIEVLKGPLSMLYGNASGGVVQVFTRSPGDRPEFSAMGYIGSDGLARSSLQFSQRQGQWGIVADAATLESDGFRQYSEARRHHFNGKLEHRDADGRTSFIANILDNSKSQDPGSRTRAEFNTNPFGANQVNITNGAGKEFTQGMVGASTERQLGGGSSLQGRVYAGTRDLRNPVIGPFIMIDRTFAGMGLSLSRPGTWRDAPLRWTAGIEADTVVDKRRAEGNVGGRPNGILQRDEDNTARSSGVFGQAEWFPSERWTLLAGLRLTQVRLAVEDRFRSDGNGSGARNYRGASPVLGITRHLNPNTNLYLQMGRGFETPTLNEVLYSPGTPSIDRFYGGIAPARSEQIEAGVKWRPAPTTRLDAAIFHIRTRDEIVPFFLSTSGSTWTNADTRRWGAEVSGSHIQHTVALRAAASVIHAEYDENFLAYTGGTIRKGFSMPGIPESRFTLDAAWRPAGWGRPSTAGIHELGIEAVVSGPMHANSLNTARAAGYDIVNLRALRSITFGPHRWTGIIRLDNALDRRYVGSVVVDQAFNRFFEPGAPRSWLLGFNYNRTF